MCFERQGQNELEGCGVRCEKNVSLQIQLHESQLVWNNVKLACAITFPILQFKC